MSYYLLNVSTVIPFAIFSPLSYSPCKIKFLTFSLTVVIFPSVFLATDSRLLKCIRFMLWNFFFFHLKNSIKNKVISININCSNCWPLSCPLLKNDKKSAFWGEYDKGYYSIYEFWFSTYSTRRLPLSPQKPCFWLRY